MTKISGNSVRNGEKGLVLLVVVVLLALLIVVVLELSFTTKSAVTVSRRYRETLQDHAAFQSGVELSSLILQLDHDRDRAIPNLRPADHLHEVWAKSYTRELGRNTTLSWSLEDANGRINLNKLVEFRGGSDVPGTRAEEGEPSSEPELTENSEYRDIVRRLFEQLRIPPQNIRRLVQYMLSGKGRSGSEEKPRRLYSLEELVDVPGFNRKMVFGGPNRPGLANYVTLWSNGKINVNTAEHRVLRALAPMHLFSDYVAESIIRLRQKGGSEGIFRRKRDLFRRPFLQDRNKLVEFLETQDAITFESDFFFLRMKVTSASYTKFARAMVRRNSQGKVQVLWLHRGKKGVFWKSGAFSR